jgi:hypothetical protein
VARLRLIQPAAGRGLLLPRYRWHAERPSVGSPQRISYGAARSRRSEGLYKARHLVEDFVAKLKQYRAVAHG